MNPQFPSPRCLDKMANLIELSELLCDALDNKRRVQRDIYRQKIESILDDAEVAGWLTAMRKAERVSGNLIVRRK